MASMKNLFRAPLIMSRGTRRLSPRMFVSSSSNPPSHGIAASEGNATQEISSDGTNSVLEESRRAILSSAAEQDVKNTAEIHDSSGSSEETAQKVEDSATGKAEESKDTLKQTAETVRRAMNNKER